MGEDTAMKKLLALICLLLVPAQLGLAADWPQYRCDAARSGYTAEELPAELSLEWTYRAAHPPRPAWQGDDTRMPFDHTYHTVIANGTLYFGSSADCKVYALDAATGAERWTFFTDAPVRFAPAVWKDRVFVVSDDGFLYCLSVQDGKPLWKKRGGPGNNMLLGNDRMVSRWPARGGPVILDDTVYFAAGIWPTEGIYLYAIDAATGETLWVNDSSGYIEMDQPHPTARAKSGVSAQGHLVASGDYLFVPTGRAVPAAFNRSDGSFRYFHLQVNRASGGSPIVSAGSHFTSVNCLFDAATGEAAGTLAFPTVAVSPQHVICAHGSKLNAFDRAHLVVEKDAVDRKGQPIKRKTLGDPEWSFEIPKAVGNQLILAGGKAVYAAKEQGIVIADTATKKALWSKDLDGLPLGFAVADGRLYVSTDQGAIHCFGSAGATPQGDLEFKKSRSLYGRNRTMARAAKRIIKETGVTQGYCLDLGCGDGALAYELAKRTDLSIYAIDSDLAKVRAAREKLDAAGLYGVRVTVHHGDPARTPYSKYFADLIVSGRSVTEDVGVVSTSEAARLLRPYGGVVCIGARRQTVKTVRGPLKDVGTWTHQYGTPANTCASTDTLVKAPLTMLWFRDSDFPMPSRHGRGPAPLVSDGRLFVEGLHALRAVDVYNGRTLWEFPLPGVLVPYDQEHLVGTAGTNSNLCVAGGILYVRVGSECLLLDPATGKLLDRFHTPAGTSGPWGYIACEDGTLFGSVSNEKHIVHWAFRGSDMSKLFTESSLFFALDAQTGELKWSFSPKCSIRHNAIAIGGGRVYLIDRPLDFGDLLEEERKRRGQPPAGAPEPPVLHALDAETGKILWSARDDIYGTLLALSLEHDVLLTTYQYTRFRLPSEKGGRMTAFRASDGTRLWVAPSDPQGKASRPLIIGTTIYHEPGAWDLLTGKRLDFHLERSYGCGIISGCENMMLYRSATLGYVDLLNDTGTINYGGIRPACWINAIPAGGLVLMPDATARCTCSYLIKASIALQPGSPRGS